MFQWLYNAALLLYWVVLAPKLLLERSSGKRHPRFLQRLGFFLPTPNREKVIWIHAVSVGEVKAGISFFRLLKEKFPDAWFCITTTTATGQAEAKRSLREADAFLYCPIDFSFSARSFIKKIRPDLFFLIETDIWPQILREIDARGGKSFLISGKLSERTFLRWKHFPSFAKDLFSRFHHLCVQTEEYRSRFLLLGVPPEKISVTRNLKRDMQPQAFERLFLPKADYLTISCTHAPEEDLLLERLKQGPWTLFLAPRHPERFEEVAQLLKRKNISFIRWKDLSRFSHEKVILVDAMGQLSSCYSLSKLALIGGSFVDKIGGHNVVEPCLYGCPSLFGPYTFSQKELARSVIENGAGMQKELDKIFESVEEILLYHAQYVLNARAMISRLRGAASMTWEALFPFLQKN